MRLSSPFKQELLGTPSTFSFTVVLPFCLFFTKGISAETYLPSISAFTCFSCESKWSRRDCHAETT
jgi:hypothetical protein